MKLALRFSALIIALTVLVMSVQAFLRVRQEVEFFRADMRRDHRLVGRTLALEIGRIWPESGEEGARQLIDRADRLGKRIEIELVLPGERAGAMARPRHPHALDLLAEQDEDAVASTVVEQAEGSALVTYVPLSLPGIGRAALELTEGLDAERRYLQRTLIATALATALLVLLTSAATLYLGRRLIGQPVEALRARARHIGEGDLASRLDLERDDEIGDLGDAIDEMSARLEQTRLALQAERDSHAATAARLASTDQARRELVEQLRHADRLGTVGTLTSSLVHELGTPLNVVSLHGKMIVDGTVAGESAQQSAAVMVEQVERMTGMIRLLLDFARAKGHRQATLDVKGLVSDTLDLLAPAARKAKVEVEIEAPPELSASVDGGHLRQVLINLASNGIQAMAEGGALRVRLAREQRHPPGDAAAPEVRCVVLAVADQGRGIPDEERARIFEAFYTTKEPDQGTGLGLHVVEEIVKEHGGWIEVASELGKGSCFTVYFPEEAQG